MKGKYLRKETKQIAITGMGSTRLAIALANYYCSYLKKIVAIAQVGEGGMADISNDSGYDIRINSFIKNNMVGFTKMKVDYYPDLNYEETIRLCKMDYDVIVLDIRNISHDYMDLFRLSSKRLLLGNIEMYNRRLFANKIKLFEHDMIEVEIYCYLLNRRDKLWYENVYRKSKVCPCVREIPFINNPYKLSKENLIFLKSLAAD